MAQEGFPQEIIDAIIDLLHDDPKALKSCCLASKRFVPRTQKYLFKNIVIKKSDMGWQWKKIFPDPVVSYPSAYTHSLVVHNMDAINTGDGKEGGWIWSFTNVVQLKVCELDHRQLTEHISLSPLHALSSVKSLHLSDCCILPMDFFKFICSFPVLEDLDIKKCQWNVKDVNVDGWSDFIEASTQQPLRGTLTIQGIQLKIIVCMLLALKTGLHFKKIEWKVDGPGECGVMVPLVEACSNTLESICIATISRGEPFILCQWFGF